MVKITDTEIKINNPEIGQVVFYNFWHSNDIYKKTHAVIILSGDYMVDGKLINHWTWYRVTAKGEIIPKLEEGYGKFTIADIVKRCKRVFAK
jgi:hypothetical protein